MAERGSSSSWKWTTTSSRETHRKSATFHPPGRRCRGSHTGEGIHKDHPERKRYKSPALPISARWPWVEIQAKRIIVRLDRRCHNPILREATTSTESQPVPWLHNLSSSKLRNSVNLHA